jgi:hypothetical protein
LTISSHEQRNLRNRGDAEERQRRRGGERERERVLVSSIGLFVW